MERYGRLEAGAKGSLKLGFLVNPIAGMGGKVGLKGTDDVHEKAVMLGAEPVAPERGIAFLTKLKQLKPTKSFQLVTCPDPMGAEEAQRAGVAADVLPMDLAAKTSAEDTKRAVQLMTDRGVALILFVGGDGTARDILDALSELDTPSLVLGIPAGVKMYSGVFAVSPADAAYIAGAFLNGETEPTEFEVMDADETAIRADRFNIRLYGYLTGPLLPRRIQGCKQVSPETVDEHENQMAVARFLVEELPREATLILGPGSTVKCVADLLGVDKTLLGVDIYRQGQLLKDVNEAATLKAIDTWDTVWIVVSPIGRQGILFGRGNQQISPEIIRLVGRERIAVLATQTKVQSIEGGVVRVDTGHAAVDAMLRGYIRVMTDYRQWRLLPVK
jgi:predicted polyphosphate/ATP-dependent NAD kinase